MVSGECVAFMPYEYSTRELCRRAGLETGESVIRGIPSKEKSIAITTLMK